MFEGRVMKKMIGFTLILTLILALAGCTKGDKVKKSDERNLARTRYVRNPKENAFSSVCMSVANMAKFAGVVGYVPIMASGVVEHAQGNVNIQLLLRGEGRIAIGKGHIEPFAARVQLREVTVVIRQNDKVVVLLCCDPSVALAEKRIAKFP